MSGPIFQNSGCVNTILGSLNQLNSILPLDYYIDLTTTLNRKYEVLQDVAPVAAPKLLYFGIGMHGCYCSTDGNDNPIHYKYQPDCRNMDLYSHIPFRIVPIDEDLSFEERRKYRMRKVKKIGETTYALYYLKMIEWDPTKVEIIRLNSDGTENNYFFTGSFLNPTPEAPSTGGAITQGDRIIVRATGICRVSMEELEDVMDKLYDRSDCMISEFGFYTGCDVYVNRNETYLAPVDDDNTDYSENNIEAAYVQLAKHKTQLPITLDSSNSSVETTVSFEASNSVSI